MRLRILLWRIAGVAVAPMFPVIMAIDMQVWGTPLRTCWLETWAAWVSAFWYPR